jgi:hypothetical protein
MGWQMIRHSEMARLFRGDGKIELNSTPAKHPRDSGVMAESEVLGLQRF